MHSRNEPGYYRPGSYDMPSVQGNGDDYQEYQVNSNIVYCMED